MNIREAPLLDNLAANQPINSNLLNPHLSSSRCNPPELTSLRTGRSSSAQYCRVLRFWRLEN